MAYTLVFTEQYNRRAKRLLKRHPDLTQHYLKTLKYWKPILTIRHYDYML